MSRGPLWSVGGALAALLAAGPGRELALLAPAYPTYPAADAAIHLASQLADSVARSGHTLQDADEVCVCEPPLPRARSARPSSLETHGLAFLAGVLLWPVADLLRLIRLLWLRRVCHAEAHLLSQVPVRVPSRP